MLEGFASAGSWSCATTTVARCRRSATSRTTAGSICRLRPAARARGDRSQAGPRASPRPSTSPASCATGRVDRGWPGLLAVLPDAATAVGTSMRRGTASVRGLTTSATVPTPTAPRNAPHVHNSRPQRRSREPHRSHERAPRGAEARQPAGRRGSRHQHTADRPRRQHETGPKHQHRDPLDPAFVVHLAVNEPREPAQRNQTRAQWCERAAGSRLRNRH